MTALISVIIPCYKQAHFLGEALESVLAQTYAHFEVIVVDDGSPDDVAVVTEKYANVRLIRQDNRGVSAARNTGIRQSRGVYLTFLDADDRLLPHALEKNLSSLEAHPECAYVAGRIRKIDADGTPIQTRQAPRAESEHYEELLRVDRTGRIMGLLFRRSVLESVGGFDQSLRAAEDFEMYLRVTRQFPIIYHDEIVAEYRRHATSTTNNKMLMYKSVMRVLRSQRPFIRGNKLYEAAFRKGLQNREDYYSGLIVNEVRASVKARKWGLALRGTRTLVSRHPYAFVTQALRKVKLQMRKVFQNNGASE